MHLILKPKPKIRSQKTNQIARAIQLWHALGFFILPINSIQKSQSKLTLENQSKQLNAAPPDGRLESQAAAPSQRSQGSALLPLPVARHWQGDRPELPVYQN